MLPKAIYKLVFLLAYTNKFPFLNYRRHKNMLGTMRESMYNHYGMVEGSISNCKIELDVRQWVDLLCWIGRFERAEQSFFRSAIRPDAIVFDIGANIGFHTLLFSQLVGKLGQVFAFEPSQSTFARLKHNVEKNGLLNVVTECLALGRDAARLPLNVTGDLGYSSFGLPIADAAVVSRDMVQVDTLDAYCNRRGLQHIDLFKMDVEGFELNVLRGASEMLAKRGISNMVVEYNRQAQLNNGFEAGQLVEEIQLYGFQISAVGSKGVEPFVYHRNIEYAELLCRLS